MIVQEKIVESKHQKKEIAEVCLNLFFYLLRHRNSVNLRIDLFPIRELKVTRPSFF